VRLAPLKPAGHNKSEGKALKMKDGTTKTQIIRGKKQHPVGVIVARREGNLVKIAVSSIGDRSEDRFDKKIGKKIAEGRLNKMRGQSVFAFPIKGELSEHDFKVGIFSTILDSTVEYDSTYEPRITGISTKARKAISRMYKVAVKPKSETETDEQ
jgi:vacuolar-type H+-ATPase subunit E/Vma4